MCMLPTPRRPAMPKRETANFSQNHRKEGGDERRLCLARHTSSPLDVNHESYEFHESGRRGRPLDGPLLRSDRSPSLGPPWLFANHACNSPHLSSSRNLWSRHYRLARIALVSGRHVPSHAMPLNSAPIRPIRAIRGPTIFRLARITPVSGRPSPSRSMPQLRLPPFVRFA
jgi:hypothetical protein